MKTKLLAMVLLGSSALFADTNFSFGINIGNPRGGRYIVQPPPPPPAPMRYAIPRNPGRGYVWVPGYWVWTGNRYNWQNGLWSRQGNRGNGYGNGFGNGRNSGPRNRYGR